MTPVALLGALSISDGKLSFLGLLPLGVVFAELARERKARLDGVGERLEACGFESRVARAS